MQYVRETEILVDQPGVCIRDQAGLVTNEFSQVVSVEEELDAIYDTWAEDVARLEEDWTEQISSLEEQV